MLRDVYWRQYPIDLLNDEKMGYIESQMPAGYEYAPYMYYITALKLADDDGIYDLDDGIIFARLMRVENVQIVFDVTNLMRKYKIIYRLSDDSQLCGIVDWTYSDKKKRTLAERKQAAANAIERERAKSMSTKDFVPTGCAGKCNDIPQSTACVGKCNDIPQGPANNPVCEAADATVPAQSAVFFMPEDDKNRKNVVINADDDKSGENVTDIQTDSTNNTVQEVHTNTHTQQQATGYGPIEGPPPAACQNSIPAVADIQNSETENQTDSKQANPSGDISMLADEAMSNNSEESEKQNTALFDYLNNFFVKNCYGYKPKQSAKAISELSQRILEVSDEMNPAVEVAAVLCGEYKKMVDGQRSDYWRGQPVLPAYMIKPRCWMELMQYAGKILATKRNQSKFEKAMAEAKARAEADSAEIEQWIYSEYEKYGIDPESPAAQAELLRAKNQEQKKLEEEPAEIPDDIF